MKHYTQAEIALIKNLRLLHKPKEIAIIVGRTVGAIHQILHRQKKKGAVYPKLRHGRLIYDKQKAIEWREMIKKGMNYKDIKRNRGIHPTTISRVLALDAKNELKW